MSEPNPKRWRAHRVCAGCDQKLARGTRGDKCRDCHWAARRAAIRACSSCGKAPLSRKNKTGYCILCLLDKRNADPVFQASRAEAIRNKFKTDPAHREKMRRIARRNSQKAAADPDYRAKLVERGRLLAATALRTPEALEKLRAVRAEAGRRGHETKMSWCPPEYRAEYKKLTVGRNIRAPKARAMILARIEAEKLAAVAATGLTSAVEFLQKFTWVRREGDQWRYGNAVLTDEQIIERAQQKGWQPFEFRRAA